MELNKMARMIPIYRVSHKNDSIVMEIPCPPCGGWLRSGGQGRTAEATCLRAQAPPDLSPDTVPHLGDHHLKHDTLQKSHARMLPWLQLCRMLIVKGQKMKMVNVLRNISSIATARDRKLESQENVWRYEELTLGTAVLVAAGLRLLSSRRDIFQILLCCR